MSMNLKVYKGFGIFLMILTFIIILVIMFNYISETKPLTRGYDQFGYIWEVVIKGILSSILVFILGFYPGLFYYRLGRDRKKDLGLVKSALIINFVAIFFVIIFAFSAIYILSIESDPLALIGPMTFFLIPALIIYSISILLLIIYKFKYGNWIFQLVEKVSFGIIILLLIIIGIVYFIGINA